MGLITGLLTLPLAPVRGTIWVARVLQEEAEKQAHDDEATIMSALAELDAARESGEFSEEEIEDAENALIERLVAIRGMSEQETNGSV